MLYYACPFYSLAGGMLCAALLWSVRCTGLFSCAMQKRRTVLLRLLQTNLFSERYILTTAARYGKTAASI
ncbi:MAG: hypothetical protein IJS44_04150 [Clostridia bacterium]|nr:hypothetical protein [Clostridia bacterium]